MRGYDGSGYLEQAVQDFQTLELYDEGPADPYSWGWIQLHDFLDMTSLIDPEHYDQLDRDGLEVSTGLGAKALELLEMSVKFGKEHLQACRATEPKLINNISPESVSSAENHSPLVLVSGDEPVGIIKTYGEKSCYGLVTEPDIGIVEGCFSQPAFIAELNRVIPRLPKTAAAWSLPVERVGAFLPLRFRAFTVPRDERLKLARNEFLFKQWRRRALVYDHEYVARRAEDMLQTAAELELELGVEELAAAA